VSNKELAQSTADAPNASHIGAPFSGGEMERGDRLTFWLAIIGTALLVLVPGVTLASLPAAVSDKIGLMPLLAGASMDLLPFALVGGLLLAWASARAASHLLPVCAGLCVSAASTISGIALSLGVSARALTWSGALIIVWWLGLLLAASAGVSLVVSLSRRRAAARVTPARG
jgi:hypothetical protein